MLFRAVFSTAFIEDNLLVLHRNEIDILWDTKHRFPVDFRVEVIGYFLHFIMLNCMHHFTFVYSYLHIMFTS
jgi:hypothetical protein